jgi:hypothetical protein
MGVSDSLELNERGGQDWEKSSVVGSGSLMVVSEVRVLDGRGGGDWEASMATLDPVPIIGGDDGGESDAMAGVRSQAYLETNEMGRK